MDPKTKRTATLYSDCGDDDQEHFIAEDSPYDWARKVSEEEAAGLD